MHPRFRTYGAYSIGCAVVWAVILIVVAGTASTGTRNKFLLAFGGWAVGWLSASIARVVYPPPKARQGPSTTG